MTKRWKKGAALSKALSVWVSSNGGYEEAHKVRTAAMRASKHRLSGPVVQDFTTGNYLSWHGGESLDVRPRIKVRTEGTAVYVWKFRREEGKALEQRYEDFHAAALDILVP